MASTAGYSAASPGWETVVSGRTSKNSKQGAGKNAAANAAKKKFVENAPKLEDVLPMEQVASFYAFEPQLKQHTLEQSQAQRSNKTQEEEKSKKNSMKNTKRSKQEQMNTPTKPKTLEEALKSFNINDFKRTLTQVKCQYPENFMLWLRDAALYLNMSLTTEDPNVELEEPVDPFSHRPASVITKETKKVLIQLLEECCDSSRQEGYETLLANMAHDLAKGFSIHGYMILLQLMSEVYPTLATIQTKRFTELIRSYQNKTNVGTALLWALGQCGRKDLSAGLKIWIEYMRPLLRMRHYSRFIVAYLSGLLRLHSSTINSGNWQKGPRILYPSQFFGLFDAIFTDALVLTKELQKEMLDQYPPLKKLAIGDCSVDHELFPEFLRRLDDFLLSNGSANYKTELLVSLSQCVANNPEACISHWQQMYRAHLHSSAKLLSYLDNNWKIVMKSKHFNGITNLQNVEELLEAFKDYNATCTSQRDGLNEASQACKSLLKKVSLKLHGNHGWFPWKLCSIFLVLGTFALINQDVQKKGSFKKSTTGLFLQDIGLFDQTVECYKFTIYSYLVGKDWAEVKVPLYYEKAKQNAGPYTTKLIQNTKVMVNEGRKFGSKLVESANDYLPGIKEKWMIISVKVSRVWSEAFDWLYKAFNLVLEWAILFCRASWHLLQETYEATKVCIKDIIDGKVDLSDVYLGIQKSFEKAVVQASKVYEYTRDKMNLVMK